MIIKTKDKQTVAGIPCCPSIVFLAEDNTDYQFLAKLRDELDKKNRRERKLNLALTLWECSYEPLEDDPFQLIISLIPNKSQ
jgi:hypothetical protein